MEIKKGFRDYFLVKNNKKVSNMWSFKYSILGDAEHKNLIQLYMTREGFIEKNTPP